jgi:adenylate cyclase
VSLSVQQDGHKRASVVHSPGVHSLRGKGVEGERVKRRLAAILAADVVGYSRLTGADEEGTIARLRALRRELIDPTIDAHGGRIVKTTGDGILIEFASVVDAVRCAVEMQRGMASRNGDVPPDKRIDFRVGIHLGDVVVEGDDLLGDGVNVAARLEAVAEPGGICVSEDAYRQVRDKVPIRFVDSGEQHFKNIARPVRVYRLTDDLSHTPRSPAALPLPDKPSIAVLPFQNMSGDPEQEYFADGITEDIITDLSRFRWFFVIARNSTFVYKGRAIDVKQVARELGVRYVLEGSVRKSAARVRISAQLIDASTGTHLWAERYDRDIADIFAVQDEITEQVAGAIEPELLKSEGRAAIARTENLSAWDLVRQGMWYFHQVTRDTHLKARELFRRAIKLDPTLPDGYIWLARVSNGIFAYGWSDDPATDLDEGMQAALRGVQFDERNPYSHYGLAIISVFSDALDQAIRAAEKAIEISPSFALGHLVLGMAQLFSGRAAQAIAPLERGLRLSPFDPQNFVWLRALALAFYFTNQGEHALEAAKRALKVRPSWRPTLETVVLCCMALDRTEEAKIFVEQMRHLDSPTADMFEGLKRHNPQWAEEMSAMLQRAGLPETADSRLMGS